MRNIMTRIVHYLVVATLLLLALVGVPACSNSSTPTPSPVPPTADPASEATAIPAPLTEETLRNAEYQSEFTEDGVAQLTDGEYRKPIMEGSATEVVVLLTDVAFGDLDGDGVEDAAVVLATDPGGSGTFYELAAVLNRSGDPEHAASVLLGDRVQIEALSVAAGEITVEMITAGPDDPMCCPSQQVVNTYALQLALVETSSELVSSGADITGITWEWVRFQGTASEDRIEVDDPSKYTLLLNSDGTYQAAADCNMASGGYTLEGNSLSLLPGPTTLAECEPGSLYDVYLAHLGEVSSFAVAGEELVLTAADGNVIFRMGGAAEEVAGEVPAEPGGMGLDPNMITLDMQGLPYSYQPNVVAATPFDASQPPGPMGLPEHIQVNFGVSSPEEVGIGDPILYIIPVAAYRQVWAQGGDEAVANNLAMLEDMLANRPDPAETRLTPLPYEAYVVTGAGRIVLGAQRQYLDLSWGTGVRFVASFMQSPNPLTNQGLHYVEQGLTHDGQYLVSFFYPVTTSALPQDLESVPAEDAEQLKADSAAYFQAERQMLNGLSTADWEPDLAVLDAVVASVSYGAPSTGLTDVLWQWVGLVETEPAAQSVVPDPENYTVVFGSDGILNIKADCNVLAGNYTLEGSALAVKLGAVTMAQCGDESQDRLYLGALRSASSYVIENGRLILTVAEPAGSMIFDSAGPAPQP